MNLRGHYLSTRVGQIQAEKEQSKALVVLIMSYLRFIHNSPLIHSQFIAVWSHGAILELRDRRLLQESRPNAIHKLSMGGH
jgi:hypothetical protein